MTPIQHSERKEMYKPCNILERPIWTLWLQTTHAKLKLIHPKSSFVKLIMFSFAGSCAAVELCSIVQPCLSYTNRYGHNIPATSPKMTVQLNQHLCEAAALTRSGSRRALVPRGKTVCRGLLHESDRKQFILFQCFEKMAVLRGFYVVSVFVQTLNDMKDVKIRQDVT